MNRMFIDRIWRITAVILALMSSPDESSSQPLTPGEGRTAEARTNLAVPDAPAFKLLGREPSNILRPATMRELTLLVSDIATGTVSLPRVFAAEFSPGMLLQGQHLTISEYRRDPFLYRTRLSVGSHRSDESGASDIAFGVRFTFLDESDPRMDDQFLTELATSARSLVAIGRSTVGDVRPDTAPLGRIDSDSTPGSREQVEALIDSARARQKERSWNADIIESGFAVRLSSDDSLARPAHADAYGVWFTAAFAVSNFGQFVFGLSSNIRRPSAGDFDSTSISLGTRLYIGSNSLKVFAEAEMTSAKRSPATYLVRMGGEVNVMNSFWLDFGGGVQNISNDRSTVTTSFQVRWSLPEGGLPW